MRPARLVAVPAALVLLAAGCGEVDRQAATAGPAVVASVRSSESGEQVLERTRAAVRAAGSARITAQGEGSGGGSVKLAFGGSGADGEVLTPAGTLRIRVVGDALYVLGDEGVWQAFSPQLATVAGGRWLKIPTSTVSSLGTDVSSMPALFDQVVDGPDGAGPAGSGAGARTVTRVPGKDVDGTPTLGLRLGGGVVSGTLYVAATGEPYPLLLEADRATPGATAGQGAGAGLLTGSLIGLFGGGDVRFSEWDVPVTVTAPPAAEVLDLASLGLAGDLSTLGMLGGLRDGLGGAGATPGLGTLGGATP